MKKAKIKDLCKICELKIYKNGNIIDISSGGIMLRGGIKEIGGKHKSVNGEFDDIPITFHPGDD